MEPRWPAIGREAKPWTRWWWMGSSVNKEDLTASLQAYQQAGLGGLEITPIYGVAGYEDRFIQYLSPAWMQMLDHTLKEAARFNLGIDMATGTGWPFGGPWVNADDACKNVAYKTYQVKEGQRLPDSVVFQQEPLVRAVGSQVYQLYGDILGVPDAKTVGSMQNPQLRVDARQIKISDLVEPISANKNLQALALDQVKFPKPLRLQTLMAYLQSGEMLDLTSKVDAQGSLNWTAPAGNWTLYAVFQGWHGKMVERAAPGGEGNVIDHFSAQAIRKYLAPFDRAFAGHDVRPVRAFFNDSYEVDDARGQADWTPFLFEEFKGRRGYDLRQHLPALFGRDTEEKNSRVLCDYRETISDLLLETFTAGWRKWVSGKQAIVRNQAHGSPANILDLYAASDIPETEGTDILRIRFASSAAHVTGKSLVSSESATWLNDHFLSSLADVRKALERYWLGGVNHVFYHGTNYSPSHEAWPGWLFYAAVHFTPANSFWTDFGTLNHYVARTQSFLQAGRPDNDVLLYFPIHDHFSARGDGMLQHFTGGLQTLGDTAFRTSAETLQQRGYAFDFISDRQLSNVVATGSTLRTGGVAYRAVILPESRYVPLETVQRLFDLVRNGARVVVFKNLPTDMPGLGQLDARRKAFQQLTVQLKFNDVGNGVKEARLGAGAFLLGGDLDKLLTRAGVERETMIDEDLQFVRRSYAGGHYYFIVNWSEKQKDGWVPLQRNDRTVAIFDPMREQRGYAKVRTSAAGKREVYLQLEPGESCVLQTFSAELSGTPYPYFQPAGAPQEIAGPWTVRFIAGGPQLPPEVKTTRLVSWTDFAGAEVKRFSGTAKYTITLQKPADDSVGWWLDLGQVRESPSVTLNGKPLGTLIGPNYRLFVPRNLLGAKNVLEIKVSNLMANRIADLDRRHVVWKKFYNVNFPASRPENRGANGLFDASKWKPLDSGLLGPVTLTPVRRM
ncbi:MAG: glycosyl hydrolase [Pyrinomonadaceae bacterium]